MDRALGAGVSSDSTSDIASLTCGALRGNSSSA